MDEDIMQQEPQNEGADSFMEGWEDTSPMQEEEASSEPGEERGGSDEGENPQSAGADSSLSEGSQEIPSEAPASSEGTAGDPAGQPGGDGQAAEQQESGTQPAPPPKMWTLTRDGQPVTISEADVPVLAQKGLEYDRLRTAYDEARPVMELFRGFAQQAGIPVQDYVARLRIQAKQTQGMDDQTARQAVELEDREARIAAQEAEDRRRQEAQRQSQARQQRRQERVQADIQEFIQVFPNAARDFQNIPKEVWDAVNGGMSLVAAYSRYNNAQAEANAQAQAEEQRRQEAVQRQNAQNAANSVGSMKSAGNNHGPKDPFLEGWDE